MNSKKSLAEKFRIIDDMVEYLKVALDTDDVQILFDVELEDLTEDDDYESLPKAAEA